MLPDRHRRHGISIWLVVTVLVISITAFGESIAHAQTDTPIRVVSSSHEVRFPQEIVFRIDAEAETTITEITVHYRYVGRTISTYGRPTFSTGTEVSAEFAAKTRGAGFVPTGVDVEYYFIIKDAQGNQLETERTTFEYRDESFDWQRLLNGQYEVIWHDIDRERVEEATRQVLDDLEPARQMLGLEELPPMKAVIVNTRDEADRTFPFTTRAARQDHLYIGFAYGEFDLFVVLGADVNGMVHESVHLALEEVVNPNPRPPVWLNEGLAMYFEGDERRREQAAQALRSGDLIERLDMNAVPADPDETRIFYAQVETFVTYLIDTYTVDSMTFFIQALASGTDPEFALTDVYGKTIDELDQEWRRSFSSTISIARRPDAGTIFSSTLVVAAAAVMFSIAALQWYVRKRRPIPDEEDDDEWDYWNNQTGT